MYKFLKISGLLISPFLVAFLFVVISSSGWFGSLPEDGNLVYSPRPIQSENLTEKQIFFGDLHVHTSYSFDAVAGKLGITPDDANRYARGEEIPFFPLNDKGMPAGIAKIDRPLDFLAVTDHGEFLGEWSMCTNKDSDYFDSGFCSEQYRAQEGSPLMLFGPIIAQKIPKRNVELCGESGDVCRNQAITPWQEMQAAANKANTPCEFTSFVGYEYTGTPGNSSYHRNVIFRNSSVPNLPVSYIDAPLDSMLWSKLDEVCDTSNNCDFLTIPHNTNLSNGSMAPYRQIPETTEAQLKYAQHRLKREPIIEIFQHKGGSECVNDLSTIFGAPDELCDIEAIRKIGRPRVLKALTLNRGVITEGVGETVIPTEECEPKVPGSRGVLGAGCIDATDFLRSSLLVGLKEERRIGINPIKLGIVASTDNHSGTPGANKESDWRGAVSGEDSPLGRLGKGMLGLPLTTAIEGNPGGLAGVWATENTRDAIFDAMLRKEVFGTSGPRIKPRLFAGWDFDENLCSQSEMIAKAYSQGVPMGDDLAPSDNENRKPKFLALATRDFNSLKLQSLQLVKGWIESNGDMHNKVIPMLERPYGEDEMCIVFTDEHFDSQQSAYYYLRAVEPPSPRWHTYDCARLEPDERPPVCTNNDYPNTIREMAWSSPIWYRGVQI